jgi:hypothetical protein
LSSPVNGEEELRGLETDTPTLILPREMGRKGFEGIFNLHIVNLFTPPLSFPINGEEELR